MLTSFISPYSQDRATARATSKGSFIEVYLDVSVDVCERRDPKGLYKKARAGEINNFTGISAPYEQPAEPEIRVNTEKLDVDACVDKIVAYLQEQGYFHADKLPTEEVAKG